MSRIAHATEEPSLLNLVPTRKAPVRTSRCVWPLSPCGPGPSACRWEAHRCL